jgi:hypothetical protein
LHAIDEVDVMSRATALQRNGNQNKASPERYTPAWLMTMLREFMGDFYDPCPPREERPIERNGLAIDWSGRVYCNPPYGKPIGAWIVKAMTEPVEEVVLLVPVYTDAAWFAPLFAHSICFIYGRLHFDLPGHGKGGKKQAPHPSALVYRGDRHEEFAACFAKIGSVMRPATLRELGGLWQELEV